MSIIEELRKKISPDMKEGEPLANHTTYKIGGPAEYFLAAKTAAQAVAAAKAAKELGLPFFVFGGGSNMLVADEGVKGVVVKMENRGFVIAGETIEAEAGAPTGLVSMRAAEAGLTGFEWAVGVPGTIGGAVRGNAGAYGGEMKDVVTSVRVLARDGGERAFTNADCGFGYRDSVFKREHGHVVLSASLALKQTSDPETAKAKLRQILLDRKEKQPVEYPTAGCMFTNWKPSSPEDVESLRKSLDLDKDEKIPLTPQGNVPAGWIIDRAQLKGMKVGHVQVSEKHGNFMLNDGKATASDVISLTAAIKMRVRNVTGGVVQLQEEVEYVGF